MGGDPETSGFIDRPSRSSRRAMANARYLCAVSGTTPAQTLFQLAAGLIPVLLFGGALLHESRSAANGAAPAANQPQAPGNRERWLAAAVGLLVVGAVFAELVAIDGMFDVNTRDWEIRTVTAALALGVMIIAIRTISSWAQDVLPPGRGRKLLWIAVPVVVATAVVAQILLTDSIRGASASQRLSIAITAAQTADNQQTSADTATEAARSSLFALMMDPSFQRLPAPKRRALTSAINEFAFELDAAAVSPTATHFYRQLSEQTRAVGQLVITAVKNPLLEQRFSDAIELFANTETRRVQARLEDAVAQREAATACQAAAEFHLCTFNKSQPLSP